MAKIGKHSGPSDEITGEGLPPRRKSAPTAADILRARGKLGPYDQPVEDTQEHLESEQRAALAEHAGDLEPYEGGSAEERPQGERIEGDPAQGKPEEEDGEPKTEVIEQPARNASRDAWVTYVEALTGEDVPEDTTRAELIELYGTPS